MKIKFLDNLANDLGFLERKELTPTSNDEVVIPEGYKIEKTPDGGFKIMPEEKLDENGLPGQSIIDLVEEKGTSKEGSKEESKEKSDKDDSKDTKADKTDSKADKAEGKDDSDDDPEEYFREESEGTEAGKSEPAKVEGHKTVNKVIVDDTSIAAAEKGDDNMMANGTTNIADLMIRFDHEKLTASVAELLTSGGKVINPKLLEIVQFAVNNNSETRDLIAGMIPEFIREYPDNIKTYQASVFEVARNIRVKYMLRCPENGTLYESMASFLSIMEKEDAHLAVEYAMGVKTLQEVWLRTDCDGNIIAQDKVLTEADVRRIVLDLPKEIQNEACDKLHLPRMVVKPSKGNKDDKSSKSGKPGNKPGKPDNNHA